MITKSQLAIALSKLKVFEEADFKSEQYPTDSEIAAQTLWLAYMRGDIEGKIADLGCGTGVLGIGALLLGAEKVYFVDNNESAINVLKENLAVYEFENYEIYKQDIEEFEQKVDVVLQNPPFGTKEKHADRKFLIKAFEISNTVYSFHKSSTRKFVESIAKDYCFKVEEIKHSFPLKQSMKHHKSRIKRIEVSSFLLEK